jgi:hypothetical protein
MLNIDITTHDRWLGFEMAGIGNSLTADTIVDIPGGAKLKFLGTLSYKSIGIPDVLQFVVDLATNVEYGLLATWLASKVEGRKIESITINRRVVTEVTALGLRQVIEEEIQIKR